MAKRNLRYAAAMSKTRTPRPISKTALENAALHYLERFSSSAENLRRILLRRVERAARFFGDDPAAGKMLVDELIARYESAGLLDDRQYAAARTQSLFRRGNSARAIRRHLAVRGVANEHIDAALVDLAAETGEESGSVDFAAAVAYARRRRLGPYRPAEMRALHRSRDLAALGRAGFSWDIACAVVDGEAV